MGGLSPTTEARRRDQAMIDALRALLDLDPLYQGAAARGQRSETRSVGSPSRLAMRPTALLSSRW